MPDLCHEPRPAVQRDGRLAPEQYPQQVVEAGEVVHMGMRDKHMRDAHQIARHQRGDVAQVEQQGAPLVEEVHEQGGVAEDAIDEAGLQQGAHGAFARGSQGARCLRGHTGRLPDPLYSE
ncbi:hypothetical protein D3C81_1038460 [compost metagenome]